MSTPKATRPPRRKFQCAGDVPVDRTDHVWFVPPDGPRRFKCCLCGAVVADGDPPAYPTPRDWLPKAIEELDDGERVLCPHPKSGGFV